MVAQTHSPFETLARVIEQFDADGRSVRRTEAAAGDGGDEPLRATLEVSVPGRVGSEGSGLSPVDASVDGGLSVTCRAPAFPDPGESLPGEYPAVSVTPTEVGVEEGTVVVTLGVTIGVDDDTADGADAGADASEAESIRDGADAGEAPSFGETQTAAGDDADDAGVGGAAGADDADTAAGADSDGGRAGDDTAGSLSAVRDESVPPYDDTPYLRRLYETCETFDEMSDRIDMDVSAETVRRYMIEAGVHSPTSYETADRSPDLSDATAATGSDAGDDPSGSADESRSGSTTPERPGEPAVDADAEADADADTGAPAPLPDEHLVADGIGLPEELTLQEVVDAVVDARTVHEVQREVGLGYDRTRHLLTQLNVLDLVVGRVAAEPDRAVTVGVVADRIRQCTPDAA